MSGAVSVMLISTKAEHNTGEEQRVRTKAKDVDGTWQTFREKGIFFSFWGCVFGGTFAALCCSCASALACVMTLWVFRWSLMLGKKLLCLTISGLTSACAVVATALQVPSRHPALTDRCRIHHTIAREIESKNVKRELCECECVFAHGWGSRESVKTRLRAFDDLQCHTHQPKHQATERRTNQANLFNIRTLRRIQHQHALDQTAQSLTVPPILVGELPSVVLHSQRNTTTLVLRRLKGRVSVGHGEERAAEGPDVDFLVERACADVEQLWCAVGHRRVLVHTNQAVSQSGQFIGRSLIREEAHLCGSVLLSQGFRAIVDLDARWDGRTKVHQNRLPFIRNHHIGWFHIACSPIRPVSVASVVEERERETERLTMRPRLHLTLSHTLSFRPGIPPSSLVFGSLGIILALLVTRGAMLDLADETLSLGAAFDSRIQSSVVNVSGLSSNGPCVGRVDSRGASHVVVHGLQGATGAEEEKKHLFFRVRGAVDGVGRDGVLHVAAFKEGQESGKSRVSVSLHARSQSQSQSGTRTSKQSFHLLPAAHNCRDSV